MEKAIATHRFPKSLWLLFAFYVLIWLFPTIRTLMIGSGQATSVSEILLTLSPDIGFAFILFLFLILITREHKWRSFWLDSKWFILFFVSNVILGLLLSGDLMLSAHGFRVCWFPMLAFLIGWYLKFKLSPQQFLKFVSSVFKLFAVFGFIGLIIYLIRPEIQRDMAVLLGYEPGEYFVLRMTSILWTPVLFGFLMAISAAYFFISILFSEDKLNYLFFGICVVCLFFSVSRGAILVFLVTFLVLSLIRFRWKKILLSLLSFMLPILLINSLVFKEGVSFSWIFSSTAETLSMEGGLTRVERWKVSFNDLKAQPYGYGLGKSGVTAYRFLSDRPVPCAPLTTDGWYLKLACETGIYGLVSFLLLAGLFIVKIWRDGQWRKDPVILIGITVFCMTLLHAVPSNSFDYYPFITWIWILISFAFHVKAPVDNGKA